MNKCGVCKRCYDNELGCPCHFDTDDELCPFAFEFINIKEHNAKIEENLNNNISQIIFEGEDTETGRKITIERIKDYVNFNDWLSK